MSLQMSRFLFLSLALGLGFASVGFAGIPTNFHTINRENNEARGREARGRYEYVGVVNGSLEPGRSFFRTYDEAESNQWSVAGGKIRSRKSGLYLAFDPSGKGNKVFLTPQAGEGSDWSVTRLTGAGEERGVIQAGPGPMKGWYLTLEKGRLILTKESSKAFEAWRVYKHN